MDTGDERVELGVVPRDVSGDRDTDWVTGEGERYMSLRGGSLNGPASGLSDGSFKSESSGSSKGYNLLDDATDDGGGGDDDNKDLIDPRCVIVVGLGATGSGALPGAVFNGIIVRMAL